jgi:hypothetical protein
VNYRVTGNLKVSAFVEALHTVVSSHDALRIRITKAKDGTLAQRAAEVPSVAELVTCEEIKAKDRKQYNLYVKARVSSDINREWLESEQVFRFSLMRNDPTDYAFSATFQHLVCDATSLLIFEGELWHLYRIFQNRKVVRQDEYHTSSFLELAKFQRGRFEHRADGPNLNYWTHKIGQAPPCFQPLQISGSRSEPLETVAYDLPFAPGQAGKIIAYSTYHHYQIAHVYLAAFSAVMFNHTDQDAISIHTIMSSRSRRDARVIGMFADSYPIIVKREPSASMARIGAIQSELMYAAAHLHIEAKKLFEITAKNRQRFGSAYFQSLSFNYIDIGPYSVDGLRRHTDLTLERGVYTPEGIPKYNGLRLTVYASRDQISANIICNSALFSPDLVTVIGQSIQEYLENMVSGLDGPLHSETSTNSAPENKMFNQHGECIASADTHRIAQLIAKSVPSGNVTVRIEHDEGTKLVAEMQGLRLSDLDGIREKCYEASRSDPLIVAPGEFRMIPGEGDVIAPERDGDDVPPERGENDVIAPERDGDDVPPERGENDVIAPERDGNDVPPEQGEGDVISPERDDVPPERVADAFPVTERPFRDVMLEILKSRFDASQDYMGFWELGGTFDMITSIQHEAVERGLPEPPERLFTQFLCLKTIANAWSSMILT